MLVAPISDENSFFVNYAIASLLRVVVVVRWIVFPAALKCRGQMSGRVDVAEQNLRQRSATLLTWIPGLNYGRHFLDPRNHVHATTGSNHKNSVLVFRSDLLNEFVLSGRQFEGAVPAFGFGQRSEADREDNDIGICSQLLGSGINPRSLRHDSHTNEGRPKSWPGVVLENDLVRRCVERGACLRNNKFLIVPVVEKQFAIQIHAEAAGRKPALLHKYVKCPCRFRDVISSPALGAAAIGHETGEINFVEVDG